MSHNQDYAAIQHLITQARAERQVYLANLIADGIVCTYNAVKAFVRLNIEGFAETKNRLSRNIFTVE